MKRLSAGALILACLVLGGCESTRNPFDPSKPLDQMNKEELCGYYAFFLTNPANSEQTRRIATAKMRDKGCSPTTAPKA